MTWIEMQLFMRLSGLALGVTAFVGAQAVMEQDWWWVLGSIFFVGLFSGIFMQCAAEIRKRNDLRGKDD